MEEIIVQPPVLIQDVEGPELDIGMKRRITQIGAHQTAVLLLDETGVIVTARPDPALDRACEVLSQGSNQGVVDELTAIIRMDLANRNGAAFFESQNGFPDCVEV